MTRSTSASVSSSSSTASDTLTPKDPLLHFNEIKVALFKLTAQRAWEMEKPWIDDKEEYDDWHEASTEMIIRLGCYEYTSQEITDDIISIAAEACHNILKDKIVIPSEVWTLDSPNKDPRVLEVFFALRLALEFFDVINKNFETDAETDTASTQHRLLPIVNNVMRELVRLCEPRYLFQFLLSGSDDDRDHFNNFHHILNIFSLYIRHQKTLVSSSESKTEANSNTSTPLDPRRIFIHQSLDGSIKEWWDGHDSYSNISPFSILILHLEPANRVCASKCILMAIECGGI